MKFDEFKMGIKTVFFFISVVACVCLAYIASVECVVLSYCFLFISAGLLIGD